jgi:hypothetical protein
MEDVGGDEVAPLIGNGSDLLGQKIKLLVAIFSVSHF